MFVTKWFLLVTHIFAALELSCGEFLSLDMSSSFSSNPESLPSFWGDVLQQACPRGEGGVGDFEKAVAFRQAVMRRGALLKLSLEDPKRADDLLNNFNLILAEAGSLPRIRNELTTLTGEIQEKVFSS